MRFKQWVKNVFVFGPMIFALHTETPFVARSVAAFFLFCITASGIYVINDVVDREKDRQHPEKCRRPLAAGLLAPAAALVGAVLLLLGGLGGAFVLGRLFFFTLAVYVGLNVFYSLVLKHVVIVDIMMIALGFVLRVIAGGTATGIFLSPWILIMTFLLAVFLGLVKRRQELVSLEGSGKATRKALQFYNLSLIDQMISISTTTTLISYIMYVLSPETQQKFHTTHLIYTVPFVIFGIFRYLYLAYSRGQGENPAEVIYSDAPFTINLIAWVTVFVLLVLH